MLEQGAFNTSADEVKLADSFDLGKVKHASTHTSWLLDGGG